MKELRLQMVWESREQAAQSMLALASPWCMQRFAEGRAVEVEFRLHEDAKSDRQRKYYHGILLMAIAHQARPNGSQHDMRTWKDYFRDIYLGEKAVTTVNPVTGEISVHQHRVSTEELGIRAYSNLIDRVSAFAAEMGVQIPMKFEEWERTGYDPDTGEFMANRAPAQRAAARRRGRACA